MNDARICTVVRIYDESKISQAKIRKHLAGQSIYEMTVWVRDYAQYLKWFCNYDKDKIEATLQQFLSVSYYLHENFKDDRNAIEDFKELCVVCVLELEQNCK